ncbi:MAG: hypothetical protein LBR44_10235 [Clostridiales Family XIII bacterium]|jgi:hypothetical protein|nr:hypothetical protein [Clostridiales Family XIII bacterium]
MKHICDITGEGLPEAGYFERLPDGACPVFEAGRIAAAGRAMACGKGTFCRNGLAQLALITEAASMNKAREGDLALLRQLCKNILIASDCAMSEHVAALVAASMDLHEEAWSDHLVRRRCQKGICPGFATNRAAPPQNLVRRRRR